jgi:alanine dehydrogenase
MSVRVGCPSEIKNHEYRVGLTPSGARELVAHGHGLIMQAGAGAAAGFTDEAYAVAGAEIVSDAASVFAVADLIVKVKEPQPIEISMLRPEQVLFTYLHLAPDPMQAEGLLRSGATAIAYETVRDQVGRLPLLAPMSEVAGRMSVQVGAHALERAQGGAGILLGGVPGVPPAKVTVLGGGVSGTNAARMASGLGARVTVLDRSLDRLRELDERFGDRFSGAIATTDAIEAHVFDSDLVIGAVLVPGAAAPRLITRAMLSCMRRGSVLVDISIDQGGCFETSRPTTHEDPIYTVDGIVHYCVANMPGAVARTSTLALTNATLPYVLALADKGWVEALRADVGLQGGLNIHAGEITHNAVAEALGLRYLAVEKVLAA